MLRPWRRRCHAGDRIPTQVPLRKLSRERAGLRDYGPMDLVEVHFTAADRTVFVGPGTTLLEAAGMAGVEILTGCTRGMCGTDAARVTTDRSDGLEIPAAHERGTLDRMGWLPAADSCARLGSGQVGSKC
jgi:ferredoxin